LNCTPSFLIALAAANSLVRHMPSELISCTTTLGSTSKYSLPLIGVHEQTYYRWRKEFGGMAVDQVKRLRELEEENAQLKKIVADHAVDLSILKEVSRGNF